MSTHSQPAVTAPPAARNRARLLIGGKWVDGASTFTVHDKFSGAPIGEADRASRSQVDAAVESAHRAFLENRLDASERFAILRRASELIEKRSDVLVRTIVDEAGFPVSDATNEVARAAQTFLISAEEGKRLVGEMVPIESAQGNAHRLAFTIRVPRGVVCGITSFNAPLNFVAHKAAPALASGNTVVIKAPQATPFSAVLLGEILLEAGLPPGHFNVVQGPGSEVGQWLVENQLIRFYSFTGSTEVGKNLYRAVGMRPVALALGSIAATIVCDDAAIERAVPRVVNSAFRRAGQACTSTQRLFVHVSVLEDFIDAFVKAADALVVGDPHLPATQIGPMISEDEAARAGDWIRQALANGARLLLGGRRERSLLWPTILVAVPPDSRVLCQEIFAPVVSVIPFRDLDEAIAQVNATPFGLAAGIFTQDINRALGAAKRLHMGVVHINESSSSRVDLIPFSGVKDSGMGREGPRYAMREMTEERLITVSL